MKIALKTTADLSKPTVDASRENVIYNAYVVNENNIKTDKLNPKKACGNETPQ